ncbi:MAG: acyltransferase domain-containing protein [Spirochaetota bacterium]
MTAAATGNASPRMDLKDALSAVGDGDLLTADGATPEGMREASLWNIYWAHSQSVIPSGTLPFLLPSAIRENWRNCSCPGEVPDELLDAAAAIQEHTALRALVWHMWWMGFHAPSHPGIKKKPYFSAFFTDRGVVYLAIALDLHRLLSEYHRAQRIDPEITRDTSRQVACFADNYQRACRKLGIFANQFFWLYHYLHEPYVRLGRLEFWYRSFPKNIRVLRRRTSGEHVILSAPGLTFDGNGQTTLPGAIPGTDGCWQSTQEYIGGVWRGNRVAKDGIVECTVSEYADADYVSILGTGSPVVDIHIPSGGGLSVEALHDSFARAYTFFAPRYPQAPPVAAVCFSWMFTRDVHAIMEPAANLPRVLRELQLYPVDQASPNGPAHVFMQDAPFSLAHAARDSSLQRSIIAWLEAGNPWRSGGMLHMFEK